MACSGYFDKWNNGNVIPSPSATGATPTIAVVDGVGNAVRPATNPEWTRTRRQPLPGSSDMRACSVRCRTASNQSGLFRRAWFRATPWDANRKAMDSTGFIRQLLAKMPLPNNYEASGSDGLNTAGYRWIRRIPGRQRRHFLIRRDWREPQADQLSNSITISTRSHKALGNLHATNDSSGRCELDDVARHVFRQPLLGVRSTCRYGLTSTLSPTIVNEARVGLRRTGFTQWNGLNDPEYRRSRSKVFPELCGVSRLSRIGNGPGKLPGQLAARRRQYANIRRPHDAAAVRGQRQLDPRRTCFQVWRRDPSWRLMGSGRRHRRHSDSPRARRRPRHVARSRRQPSARRICPDSPALQPQAITCGCGIC